MKKHMYFLCLLLLFASPHVFAATITLTSPLTNSSVTEGDEFFTDVLGNRMDFNERRDFMWEEHFSESSIGVSNGIWSGTFDATGGYVFPLFQGYPLALNSGLVGANYPIDSTKYTYVSVRSTVNSRSTKAVYWTREVNWPDGNGNSSAAYDGYFTNTQGVRFGANEWVVDQYNFSSNANWTGQAIKGVRLDPSTSAPSGTTASYDWVRICDPNSAPYATITWTTASVPQPNPAIVPQVNIYMDTDAAGYDGSFLSRVAYNAGSYSFPTASLPPGTYYFYLKLYNNTDSDTLLATSSYSAAIVVNGKSKITFTNPSKTSGEDYAQTVLGNSWMMDDTADVANLGMPMYQQNFQNWSFTNGAFQAEAIIPSDAGGQVESDSQVWLNINPQAPIDTSKYRYLTYTMAIDSSQYGNISDKVGRGFISRIIWWNTGIETDGSESKGNVVYEGVNTYTVDLKSSDILSLDNTYPANTGWTGNATISNLRLDPTETSIPTWFYIYDVKLTANPEPDDNNTFTIQFTSEDPEGEGATIAFYGDTNSSGYDGVYIGAAGFNPGTNSFTFSAASLPSGDLYIYAVVTDSAGNVSMRYADAPVTVNMAVWHNWFAVDSKETPMVGDFNGDGLTDIITFTRDNPNAVGDVYVALSSGTGFGENTKWHDWFAINQDETVVIGDFNGDDIDDLATWLRTGTRQVYVALSQGTGMETERIWLGSIGADQTDILKTGDVNGDDRDDLVLFARQSGTVYVALSHGDGFDSPQAWHNWFAVSTYERPEVGDVDGDGMDDIITFATDSPTAQGDVFVALSDSARFSDGNNSDKWNDWFAVESSQRVQIGDIDGDNRDDFATFLSTPWNQVYAVYSEGAGMSDNYLIASDFPSSSTDQPFLGDVNGDGRDDLIVFVQSEGKVKVSVTP